MNTPAPETFPRNLAALRATHPALAERIETATPAPLDWSEARDGSPVAATAESAVGGRQTLLCSKYDPLGEADKLLSSVDFAKSACVVLIGLGVGHHASLASERLGEQGLLVVYEPDTAQLAAVMRRLDLTHWLGQPNRLLLGEGDDRATLTALCDGHAHLVTQGTQLVTLPAGRARFGQAYTDFGQTVAEFVAFCRTNIATALVNAARTCRNLAANLDVYAAGATTDALRDAAKGYPAICVGAGPSLVKNIDLLRDPTLRSSVVLIAVQTALRPLLDRGIRPDFVTALDYSPICARFYEGLPDLPDVTLVAEPKANAAILDAFPGPVRVTRSAFSDVALGDPARGGLARSITPIKGGATVAHLSFYLARHLGCDPIMFIGQDLGFSDGLYYAPGTAVHQVWDCELGPFNTLEMMEWQRVVRMRGHLRKFHDVHGRPIYSDEQMITYLRQFERDFADAQAEGITVIDATEGGMPKQHVETLPLTEALDRYALRTIPALPIPERGLDRDRLAKLRHLLTRRRNELRELRRMSEESVELIRKMQQCCDDGDKARLDKLFKKLERNRKRVEGDLKDAFALVHHLNTIGTFRRSRADRGIAQQTGQNTRQKFRQQLARDLENIEWIVQACDEGLTIFAEASERMKRHDLTPTPVICKTPAAVRETAA